MGPEQYSIQDIAMLTMLSDRTIRNYLRMGLLSGRKRGGKWNFSAQEISQFLDDPFVRQALEAKRAAMVSDFLAESHQTTAAVCVVADFPASDAAETLRLQQLLIHLVNQADGTVRMNCSYHPRQRQVRVYLSGSKDQILPILNAL